jgi:hypothetical protein
MIVAFYPGAGGNRYLRMTQDKEWQLHGRSYDDVVRNQSSLNRYIYPDREYSITDDVILTHCVNTKLIRNTWPNHAITVIIMDLQPCLRREWILHGHERYLGKVDQTKIDKIDLYNAIKDASWPQVEHPQDIALLPGHIQQEFDIAYSKMIDPVTDVCGNLKKEYSQKIDSACSQIQWHRDYYETYPLDLSCCDTVIDLKDNTRFSHLMQQELSLYPSEIFDRCWAMIHDR